MDKINRPPRFVKMAIMGDVLCLYEALVAQGGQSLVQLIEIVSMDEKVQVHRCPDMAQNPQSEPADSRVPDLMMIEFR